VYDSIIFGLSIDDPRLGTVLEDRYRIEERVASGGMGVVYRAERIGLAKSVAVKFLHSSSAVVPERIERFDREAAAMSRLSHPNLVSVIDFGSADGVPYLVMEYHSGLSLEELLASGPLNPGRAVFIAHQILAGLGSAHDSGVVHRDLKPGNILIVGAPGEDFVKIFDFGVAKLLDTGAGPSELSVVAARVLGTPEYMAPEQARCEAIDARTDLYAAGLILYEMVTGQRPFSGGGNLAVLRKQIEDEPISPSSLAPAISRELEQTIVRALQKDRDARWQSASDFALALACLPEGSGVRSLRGRGDAMPDNQLGSAPATAQLPVRASGRGRGARFIALSSLLLVMVAGALVAAVVLGRAELAGIGGPDWLGGGVEARATQAAGERPAMAPSLASPPVWAPPDAAIATVAPDAAFLSVAPPDAAAVSLPAADAALLSTAGDERGVAAAEVWLDAGVDRPVRGRPTGSRRPRRRPR
jgi:hypothetical protein